MAHGRSRRRAQPAGHARPATQCGRTSAAPAARLQAPKRCAWSWPISRKNAAPGFALVQGLQGIHGVTLACCAVFRNRRPARAACRQRPTAHMAKRCVAALSGRLLCQARTRWHDQQDVQVQILQGGSRQSHVAAMRRIERAAEHTDTPGRRRFCTHVRITIRP
jgi:hypothetical protein